MYTNTIVIFDGNAHAWSPSNDRDNMNAANDFGIASPQLFYENTSVVNFHDGCTNQEEGRQ